MQKIYDMTGFDGHVASLFDGGWRPDDAELMVQSYEGLTREEADRICERMAEMIEDGILKEASE